MLSRQNVSSWGRTGTGHQAVVKLGAATKQLPANTGRQARDRTFSSHFETMFSTGNAALGLSPKGLTKQHFRHLCKSGSSCLPPLDFCLTKQMKNFSFDLFIVQLCCTSKSNDDKIDRQSKLLPLAAKKLPDSTLQPITPCSSLINFFCYCDSQPAFHWCRKRCARR
jgi:hypothetical protein